ncbi:unnamed protein product, partial [Closterium sp. Naga37s-1]
PHFSFTLQQLSLPAVGDALKTHEQPGHVFYFPSMLTSHCSVFSLRFIDQLLADPRFAARLQAPSVSFYGSNLYLRAPAVLEEATRPNLSKPLKELMDGVGCVNGEECGENKGVSAGGVLNVNDKKLAGVLRVRVSFKDEL